MKADKFRLRNWERFQDKKKKERARKEYKTLSALMDEGIALGITTEEGLIAYVRAHL